MYFAVSKLNFEDADLDLKTMKALTEKIRSRFKVAVHGGHIDGAPIVAIATLGESEEKLLQTIDEISELCEASGFGRVSSEDTLLDDMRCLGEEEQSNESE
jgi:hypothetical protein